MEKKYIKFFEGYKLAYGVADMSTLKVDQKAESGNQFTDGTMRNLQNKYTSII